VFWEGIDAHGGSRLTIDNNTVRNSGDGIALAQGTASIHLGSDNTVTNNLIEDSSKRGIVVIGQSSAPRSRNTISGNTLRRTAGEGLLAFYTDDVIFHSPLVARLSHDPSGTVQGKAALRAYVKKGFEVFDHIKFTVLDVLRGVDSIAIHYKGITGTHVVEVLFFDKDGLVRESYVHYSSPE